MDPQTRPAVVLDENGFVRDGLHRVASALLNHEERISTAIADDRKGQAARNLFPVHAGELTSAVGIRQALADNPQVSFFTYDRNGNVLARVTPGGSFKFHEPYGRFSPGQLVGYVAIAVGSAHFTVEDIGRPYKTTAAREQEVSHHGRYHSS